MSEHAILSASSAHRWLACTPSARLELEFNDNSGAAADEGTAAHALAEHKLRKVLKMNSKKPVSKYDNYEMEAYTDDYVAFVLEQIAQAKQTCSDPMVLIEQKLDFSKYVKDGFGTGDCIIIADEMLQIVDFKYGKGVLVEAENNPQMMLYALGALEIFDCIYDIDKVSMTIYQPRRDNVSIHTVSKQSLYQWAEEILKPAAELAYAGEGEFKCGEWCRFCRAKAECRERAKVNMALAAYDFQEPALLGNDEIASILSKIDELVSWAGDVKEFALQQALKGVEYKGFKVVEGRSNRKYTNETAVADAVIMAGYNPYEQRILGVTDLEKLLGKKKFNEILGGLVEKLPGKPTLVPENDKRPALTMNSAADDFKDAIE